LDAGLAVTGALDLPAGAGASEHATSAPVSAHATKDLNPDVTKKPKAEPSPSVGLRPKKLRRA
jgi:hypothetical protein